MSQPVRHAIRDIFWILFPTCATCATLLDVPHAMLEYASSATRPKATTCKEHLVWNATKRRASSSTQLLFRAKRARYRIVMNANPLISAKNVTRQRHITSNPILYATTVTHQQMTSSTPPCNANTAHWPSAQFVHPWVVANHATTLRATSSIPRIYAPHALYQIALNVIPLLNARLAMRVTNFCSTLLLSYANNVKFKDA